MTDGNRREEEEEERGRGGRRGPHENPGVEGAMMGERRWGDELEEGGGRGGLNS